MIRLPAPGHVLHLVLGHALWLVWLTLAYGGLSVACEVAPPQAAGPMNLLNGALLLLTLLVAALLAWGAWACWRAPGRPNGPQEPPGSRFLPRLSAWLYGASALATLLTGLPLLAVPPCV